MADGDARVDAVLEPRSAASLSTTVRVPRGRSPGATAGVSGVHGVRRSSASSGSPSAFHSGGDILLLPFGSPACEGQFTGAAGRAGPSGKLSSQLDGCRSLDIVLDSISLIRSLVTPYTLPISSSVFGWPSVRPNRIDTTPASRSESVSSTECNCS